MNGIAWIMIVAATGLAPQKQWTTDDYGKALAAARAAERPLMVVLEDPHAESGQLAALGDPKLEKVLGNFEVCRIDISSSYGKKVAAVYGAESAPYSVITDKTCRQIVFRGLGNFTTESWQSTLDFYKGDLAVPNIKPHTQKAQPTVVTTLKPVIEDEQAKPFSHPDLESAMSKAQDLGRPLLVYITMPGCRYCDKMKAETFSNHAVSRRIVSDFESVIVDLKDRPDWVAEQNIKVYPTTLILSPMGETLSKIDGFVPADELTRRLRLGSDLLSGN